MFRHFRNAIRRASKRTPRRARHSAFESLQPRLTPVVGAFSVPAALPWYSHDGVVQVNVSFSDAGGFMGSGTLLSTGQHILTAAHVVTTSNGSIATLTNVTVTFRTQANSTATQQLETYIVPVGNVTVHPSWNGVNDDNYGHDLAIIRLPSLAPIDANRHDLYRATDEKGKLVTFVGYGRTGSGEEGAKIAPDGNRRQGSNQVDDLSLDPWWSAVTAGPDGTVLTYDFDEQYTDSTTAPGDSGGPLFIGSRVAGVVSMGLETAIAGGDPESNFGELASATRVSSFANWIDSVLAATRPVVLDLSLEAGDSNGVADRVELTPLGNTLLEIKLNGNLHDIILVSQIASLTLLGTNDEDTFVFNGRSSTFPATTIAAGAGADTLVVADGQNVFLVSGANAGAVGQITFNSVGNLTGGLLGDTFLIGQSASLSGRIDGGGGIDSLDYGFWTQSVTVNLATRAASSIGTGVVRIENVSGGANRDWLTGDGNANTLRGGGGIDTLRGGGGGDMLYGGADNDFLYGEAGADWLFGEAGADTLDGGFDGLFDYLFGDNYGQVDEIDTIYNHSYLSGLLWVYEDDMTHLSARDRLVMVAH